MAILSKAPEVAFIGVMALALYLWHQRQMVKLGRKTDAKDSEAESDMKKMKERLENLESMICNLDREMNLQLERTSAKFATLAPSDVSQFPTSFMNVATVLEERYQILKELGRGGMGIVFQAHDKQLNEQVAIKILSPLLSTDTEALERLKREVSAARRITHPNVIRIHDIGENKGLHYVSMEYFSGCNLKEYVQQNRPLSLRQAYDVGIQICDAIEAAHRQGVIHRDLKSQNIIINPTGHIKVIDFGLAHTAHLQGMTATGLIMGTPEYMSPEQVAGKRVDERTDIYSFGIILYELFTGRVPFHGDSAIAVGFKQIKEAPQSPSEINTQIPTEVEKVILKALEKDPSRRFGSVTEIKAALQTIFAAPELHRASDTTPPGHKLPQMQ
jgi:serine/threonine protein kinase